MANGDLLTADYQFQLHNTLYGTGNQGVSLDLAHPIEGIGVPDAKTHDVVYEGNDGTYANPDYLAMRVITIPVILKSTGATPAATVGANYKALVQAWIPLTSDTDLAFQLPGIKFYCSGRPRGVKGDLQYLRFGAVRALLRFDCPTPTFTYI